MDTIKLSINPSYLCNFRCPFCYLSPGQLGNSKKLDLGILFNRLEEIAQFRKIERIDIYGGETGALEDTYLQDLVTNIRIFYSEQISIITNLSQIKPLFLHDEIDLSVSWDYLARERWELVYRNMKSINRPFHLLILASPKLVNLEDVEFDKMISLINAIPNIETVEIKPYSKNANNDLPISFVDHENWIKKWLSCSKSFKFNFINEQKIQNSISKKYSSWSDDHLYINPDGKFAVLEFDSNDREFFKELKDFNEYENWCQSEKQRIGENQFCSKCKYHGACLSEHLQEVKDQKSSCNGFYGLLNWYENERL